MLCQEFRGVRPTLKPGCLVAPNATVIGKVTLEERASLWHGAIARGDQNTIRVGRNTNIQEQVILHVSVRDPLVIGEDCVVGHAAILHGCTVGNNCLIGMGAIVLDGAVVGDNCLVAAGALVPPGAVIPPGTLVMGSPAQVRRTRTPEEIAENRLMADSYHTRALELLELQG